MPRPKDAKVWNEDLIIALEARHQKCLREAKRDSHMWRVGREKIEAVRKDIYQFRTGTIVNIPTNLTKRVNRLCEDIIRGIKSVYPDGHVPTNAGAGMDTIDGGYLSTAATATAAAARTAASPSKSTTTNNNNPFNNDHYIKNIKIRGGTFAILMAFRYSQTDVLRKNQICKEGQRFCDDQMEANFHAGRTYGAWSSINTLKSRHLVKEQGFANFSPGRGFRDRPHTYSLTRDGELFIEALFANRPEAAAAARQVVGVEPTPRFGGAGAGMAGSYNIDSPFGNRFSGRTADHTAMSPSTTRIITSNKSSANKDADRAELEQWITTANVGDRKDFDVGKDRRKHLHDLCDSLQAEKPGLLLTHGSSGTSRARTLSIQLVSKPSLVSSTLVVAGKKRPLSPTLSGGFPGLGQSAAGVAASPAAKHSRTNLTPRENAALSAMRREAQTREVIDLKKAIAESKKPATYNKHRRKALFDNNKVAIKEDIRENTGGDEELEKAIKASLQETKKPRAVKNDIFSIDIDSDDELPEPIFSPSPSRKKRKKNPLQEAKKPRAVASKEICFIDSESDNDELSRSAFSSPIRRKRERESMKQTKKPRAVTSEELSKAGPSIDLCESSDENDEDDVIEVMKESQEEPIDIVNCQSQGIDYIDDGEGIDDDVVIVDDGDDPVQQSASAKVSSSNTDPKNDNSLTIMIDNRERNRNATPRTLRMELTRHLASGPLSAVWPATLPRAKVEEVGLAWGDIQYSVQAGNSESRRLGVSIERKRVNDLVQRSFDGDHLAQLFRMRQHCSLSILLIENDTRTASNVTAYNAQNREGFDPLDSTITCEDDVFRMFGRVILSCDTIKFMQTKDEQASLRAIGALGLMSVSAPVKYTSELIQQPHASGGRVNNNPDGVQALCDQLTQSGIPWRLAKRVASAVGGSRQLKALYDSCYDEKAKSNILAHIVGNGNEQDQDGLRSSVTGWSDAIYRIVTCPTSSSKTRLSGDAALLLHKEIIHDHGFYLTTLYQGHSHEETLERVLNNPTSLQSSTELVTRYVSICLTDDQATKYFPPRADDRTFYKLSIISVSESQNCSSSITMRTVGESLASKALSIFEMEGSNLVDLIRDTWSAKKGDVEFVALAKELARLVNDRSKYRGRGQLSAKRIILVCGLQPALDANAKKSGYAAETRTVVDLLIAELLLCYDITIIQALRKKMDDRVNVVKQLALACFYYGFLVENIGNK